MKTKKYALILAGGNGSRAGGEVPKQFQLLCGLPVLWWSVKAFYEEDPATQIRIVLHPGYFDLWDILFDALPEEDKKIEYTLVCGGRDRLSSVQNGLAGIDEADDAAAFVAVHDAARPLLTPSLVRRGWESVKESGASIPVVPMTDSIRRIFPEGSVALDRTEYVRVQTPQVFSLPLLREAYSRSLTNTMTDDASVVEAAGHSVTLFQGEENNLKITNPSDLRMAEAVMGGE